MKTKTKTKHGSFPALLHVCCNNDFKQNDLIIVGKNHGRLIWVEDNDPIATYTLVSTGRYNVKTKIVSD